MRNKLLATAFAVGISIASHGVLAAETFESIAVGSYPSIVSGNITYSLSSGDIRVNNDSNGQYVLAPSGTHFIDNYNSQSASFIFELNAPVESFGMQIGATNSTATLSAYSISNTLLGSITIPNQVANNLPSFSGFYTLNFAGISKVVLTPNGSDWIVVDNVAAPVPEPETYAMFLAGLGLMGLLARRRVAA